MTVTTGSIALRSTWRLRMTRAVRPLASAVRTKSASMVSSTEARVMRKMMAKGMVASATAGRIRWRIASQAASHSRVSSPSRTNRPVTRVASRLGSCRPETGRSCHSTATKYLSRKAVKKTGTATPIGRRRRPPSRGRIPCGARRSSPAGCRARRPAPSRRWPARWSRGAGSGRPGRRPPRAAPASRHRTRRAGRVRRTGGTGRRPAGRGPRAASRAARRSGVARSPRIAETGPPGSALSHTNKQHGQDHEHDQTICSIRRTMNRTTTAPSQFGVGQCRGGPPCW